MPRDPLEALRLPVVPVEPRPAFAATLSRRIQGEREPTPHAATVRYFVNDMDAAVAFYCGSLGFEEELQRGLLGSPAQMEAVTANFEKRHPRFEDPE